MASMRIVLRLKRYNDGHHFYWCLVCRPISDWAGQRIFHDLLSALHTREQPGEIPRTLFDDIPVLHLFCMILSYVQPPQN